MGARLSDSDPLPADILTRRLRSSASDCAPRTSAPADSLTRRGREALDVHHIQGVEQAPERVYDPASLLAV